MRKASLEEFAILPRDYVQSLERGAPAWRTRNLLRRSASEEMDCGFAPCGSPRNDNARGALCVGPVLSFMVFPRTNPSPSCLNAAGDCRAGQSKDDRQWELCRL